MKNGTWLIYVDIIKFNIFGYIKKQLEVSNDVEILWGIDKDDLQRVEAGQETYFYLTNIKRTHNDQKKYHFLKRFIFKGEIVEITDTRPNDEEFWSRNMKTDIEAPFEKYARIRIKEDYTDKMILSNVIKWKGGFKNSRRMFLLCQEDLLGLETAIRNASRLI